MSVRRYPSKETILKVIKERSGGGGRLLPTNLTDKQGRLISGEQIKEWLCEAIEGEAYNYGYGYKKLTLLLKRSKKLIINHKKVYRLC